MYNVQQELYHWNEPIPMAEEESCSHAITTLRTESYCHMEVNVTSYP